MDRVSQRPLAGGLAIAVAIFLAALMLSAGPVPNVHPYSLGSGATSTPTPPTPNGSAPAGNATPPGDLVYDLDHVWLGVRVLLDPGQERTVAVPCAKNQTVTSLDADENGSPINTTFYANEGDLHLDFELLFMGSNITEWKGQGVQSVTWTDSPNRTSEYADDNLSGHDSRKMGNETDPRLEEFLACRVLADGDQVLLEFGATLHLADGTDETVASRITFVRVDASMADVWNWEPGAACPAPACG